MTNEIDETEDPVESFELDDRDIEGMTLDELSEALADMEKALEDLGNTFVYASIGVGDLPEVLNLALEQTFPTWSRHNPVFFGSKGTSVQIRPLYWPERLLARLLAASMSERVPDRVSDFLYWRLMFASERVFKYYDKRHYGDDESQSG